nr:hypothetical protein [Tanacetum cinerariifolium]
MVGGNGGNQFRQYVGQNAGNPGGYNDVIGNQVNQNVVQNPRVYNGGNQNGLIGVQGNGNQNQIENGNLVAARAEGNAAEKNGNQIRCYNFRGVEEYDLMAAAADLDEIEEVNANCILMANLQQASTSDSQTDSAPVYDTDGSAEPKNFSDDFMLITLGAMFEKPNIQAQIWKTQRSVHGQAKVKSWKLLESCGVQIITFTTTQLILLVEKRCPLT